MKTRTIRTAVALGAAALIASVLTGCGPDQPNPTATSPGAGEGTLTITAPLRVVGAEGIHGPDSVLVTLSKNLADEGWAPALSDGSCKLLSPGVNTQFTGADGVQVTTFDQVKPDATHVLITKSGEDPNCDLEYKIPTPEEKTFTTTIDVG